MTTKKANALLASAMPEQDARIAAAAATLTTARTAVVESIKKQYVRLYVKTAKAEIVHYARTDSRFYNAETVSELHDYCDANLIGETELMLDELQEVLGEQAGLDLSCDVMNAGGEILDRWMASGELREAVAAEDAKDALEGLKWKGGQQ